MSEGAEAHCGEASEIQCYHFSVRLITFSVESWRSV